MKLCAAGRREKEGGGESGRGGNATTFNKKWLAEVVFCRTLWAAWMTAFGTNPSNDSHLKVKEEGGA